MRERSHQSVKVSVGAGDSCRETTTAKDFEPNFMAICATQKEMISVLDILRAECARTEVL
jgi:hypothetical protein